MSERPLLGSILCARNLLTADQLHEALKQQVRLGKPLGRVLVEAGYVREEDVCDALGVQHGLSTIQLKKMIIAPDVLARVPEDVVKMYSVIPVSYDGRQLTLATDDVMQVANADALKFILGKDIQWVLTGPKDLQWARAKYYQLATASDEKKDALPASSLAEMETYVRSHADEAPVVELVQMIVMQAIRDRASDIHFESLWEGLRVRSRLDGALVEVMVLPKELSSAVISRIKVMANMDIAETRLPQDGRIDFMVADKRMDVRVSTLPTIYGESAVLRVLDKGVTTLSLSDLGLLHEDQQTIERSLQHNAGMILVTGPTGSGKTTSLYAMLKMINTTDKKAITVEDPVEYELDGAIQVTVKAKIGLSFAHCLRHILRQDPDILMVGEIRDHETLAMSVQAALTGHLVLSTLHTNDAPGCLTRLMDMGVEPFMLTATLNMIVAQRLVRRICPFCKEQCVPEDRLLKELNMSSKDLSLRKFYRGRGCDRCQLSGYKGRLGLFEILQITPEVKQLILQKSSTSKVRAQACREGMVLLREDGLEKVYQGLTTLEEVLQETQDEIQGLQIL